MSRIIYHTLEPDEIDAMKRIAERFAKAQGRNETFETIFGTGTLVASQTTGAYQLAVVVDTPDPSG